MTPSVKAVCFDFDGTLAHYGGNFAAFAARSFAALGVETELGRALAAFSSCEKRNGHITVPKILRCALERLDLKTLADIEVVSEGMLEDYAAEVRLLPGADVVLALTAALPTAIITNGPSDMQRAAIAAAGVGNRVQQVVVSGDEDVALRKPDARIFELACQRLGIEAQNVLMIGDNLESDVKGALAAGMQALWLSKGWLGEGEAGVEAVKGTLELSGYLKAILPA